MSSWGNKCAKCEEVFDFYHIDHVSPFDKKFWLLGPQWSIRWDRWIDELEKCQLLCVTCHYDKTEYERQNRVELLQEFLREQADCPF